MDTIKKMRGEMEETHSACSAVETNSQGASLRWKEKWVQINHDKSVKRSKGSVDLEEEIKLPDISSAKKPPRAPMPLPR